MDRMFSGIVQGKHQWPLGRLYLIIVPPLEGETFDEIQNWKYWIPWSEALDRLIQLCEENRFNVIYPQDICLGTTLWSGDKLLAGRAITIFEE